MDEFERENMRWAPRSQPAKGPARLCRFCFFSILLPITFLCVPLYMRFVSLRPHVFTLSPTDMKLLNHEHRVSTTWCRAQTLKMNSTFRAYLLPERPKLRSQKHRVQMERKIVELEDDMKEYWGFYLLKHSHYKVSVCSRHEGASVVVIKHSKNVQRCAWLGELDSAEESDEISNEFDFKNEVLDVEEEQARPSIELEASSEESMQMMPATSKELNTSLANIQRWSPGSRKKLVKHLIQQMLNDRSSGQQEEKLMALSQQFGLAGDPESEQEIRAEAVTVRALNLTDTDQAGEVFGDFNGGAEYGNSQVFNLFNQGKFNQKNVDGNKKDTSNEETRSSWSSSEEALAACEGAVDNIALDGATRCNENSTFEEMWPFMTHLEHNVDSTGFYYFIFTNDNEITNNFVAASFDMRKTVFDVTSRSQECNSTECRIPLSFMSQEHLVLEVPQQENAECEYEAEGVTNYYQCNTVVTAESICEPRGSVYMTFLLLVPFFILLFAYI